MALGGPRDSLDVLREQQSLTKVAQVMAGFQHINHLLHTTRLELDGGVELPETRRGYPRGVARIQFPDEDERRRFRAMLAALDVPARLDAGAARAKTSFVAVFSGDERATVESLLNGEAIKGVDPLGALKRARPAFFVLDGGSSTRRGAADGPDGPAATAEAPGDGAPPHDAQTDDFDAGTLTGADGGAGAGAADGADADSDADDRDPADVVGDEADAKGRYSDWRVKRLREKLSERGLKKSGVKADLILRLISYDAAEAGLEGLNQELDSGKKGKRQTKQAIAERKRLASLEIILDEVERREDLGTPEGRTAPVEVRRLLAEVRAYARLHNATFRKASRERQGKNHKFMDQQQLGGEAAMAGSDDDDDDDAGLEEVDGRVFFEDCSAPDGFQDVTRPEPVEFLSAEDVAGGDVHLLLCFEDLTWARGRIDDFRPTEKKWNFFINWHGDARLWQYPEPVGVRLENYFGDTAAAPRPGNWRYVREDP